jgi:hypothetical protein
MTSALIGIVMGLIGGGLFWLGLQEGMELCRYNGHCLRPEYRKGRVEPVGVFPFCYWCSRPTVDKEHCTVIHIITDGKPELDRHISVHVDDCLAKTLDLFTAEGYPL